MVTVRLCDNAMCVPPHTPEPHTTFYPYPYHLLTIPANPFPGLLSTGHLQHSLKGRVPKKNVFFMVFCQTGGRGVSEGSEKTILLFWRRKKVFFQRACRIILVPPKHVLHLVWSPYVIYTAIRTALKEAWEARILGKKRSESKNKKTRILEWDQV